MYSLRSSLLFYFAMSRRMIFNELLEYYWKFLPHHKDKQQVVANEWKNIKDIEDNNEFMNAVSSEKTMKRSSNKRGERKTQQILHGCQKRKTCNSFC